MSKGIQMMALNAIKPYPNNPRKNDDAVGKVAESIKEFGFQQPIIVDKDKVIIAGHTRYKAAQSLGLDKVPVIVADELTEEQANAYRLVDNKTGELAGWDFELLDLELEGIDEIDMEALGFTSYSPDDFGEDFELPDGEKADICQITFYLHNEQAELIKYAMDKVKDEVRETFGNLNQHGNELYEVVRQWAEQRR